MAFLQRRHYDVDGTITDCQLIDIDRNGRLDIIAIAPENVYVLSGTMPTVRS